MRRRKDDLRNADAGREFETEGARAALLVTPPRQLILLSLLVHIASSVLATSYAAPDGHYQGPEVAHGLVFGTGYATWEWWPRARLRSYLHPALLALAYAPFRAFTPAPLWALWLAPRLVHAGLACIQDVATSVWAAALSAGDNAERVRVGRCALLLNLFNWLALFGGARAFGNSLQASLLAVAAATWQTALLPLVNSDSGSAAKATPRAMLAGVTAALALSAHPTSVAPIAALFVVGVAQMRAAGRGGQRSILTAAAAGAVTGSLCVHALDAFCSGAGVSGLLHPPPFLAFLRANVFEGLDALSGSLPAHWLLWAGLPLTAGFFLPLVAVDLAGGWGWARLTGDAPLAWGGAVLATLCLASHKEDRYLLPLVPPFSVCAARGCARVVRHLGACYRPALALCAALHCALVLYLHTIHQRGPVAAIEFVADTASRFLRDSNFTGNSGSWAHEQHLLSHVLAPLSLHVLMPCHSTPLYSVLHFPMEARLLDCSPGAVTARGSAMWARDRVCTVSGCCSPLDLPPLSESGAWVRDKARTLTALYGGVEGEHSSFLQPVACAAGTGDGGEEVDTLAWQGMWAGATRWDASAAAQEGAADMLFTIPPAAFASVFAASTCMAAPPSGSRLPRRRLPSHAVLFDTDASHPDVAPWLEARGYHRAAAFSMGHFQGDAHAAAQGRGEPAEVVVFEHRCWAEKRV